MKILQLFTFSDLHINARSSRYEEIAEGLMRAIESSDIVQLNGDIIEMFYPKQLSRFGNVFAPVIEGTKNTISLVRDITLHGDGARVATPKLLKAEEETLSAYIEAAKDGAEWIENLLKKFPDKKFMYLEGNHENCDVFRENIYALRKAYPNLVWGRTYMSIGNGHFFHGDNEIRNEEVEKRERGQLKDIHSGKFSEGVNLTGEMPAMRFLRWWNKDNKIVDRIYNFLEKIHPERMAKTEHMFFGHTHLLFTALSRHGKFWYNTGSASNFGKDNFLTLELHVPEGCNFETDDKRVFFPEAKIENVRRVDVGGRYSEIIEQERTVVSRMIR